MHYLVRNADPWRDSIAALLHDVDAGLVTDWPHAYVSGAVEAVRYIRNETGACRAEMLDG